MPAPDPTVSVVVPVYNKRSFILSCMACLRSQTFTDFEVVVVDDGSTDGSPDSVRPCLTERDQLITQPNCGCGPARNTGIAAARGRYIAFFDADDEWDPDYLATMVGLLTEYPEAGMAACATRSLDDVKMEHRTVELLPPGSQAGLVHDYLRRCAAACLFDPHPSSVTIPKAVLDDVGGWQPVRYQEDCDLYVRIGCKYPVAYTTRPLHSYRRNVSGSIMSTVPPTRPPFVEATEERLRRGAVPPDKVRVVRGLCCAYLLLYAKWLHEYGRWREARAAAREAVRGFGLPPRRAWPWLAGVLAPPWLTGVAHELVRCTRRIRAGRRQSADEGAPD